ncbi:MAG: hypothetical protein HC848_11070 [Limnobacter sp.]|nr:hypothetical protein [Limnobacter sp.]
MPEDLAAESNLLAQGSVFQNFMYKSQSSSLGSRLNRSKQFYNAFLAVYERTISTRGRLAVGSNKMKKHRASCEFLHFYGESYLNNSARLNESGFHQLRTLLTSGVKGFSGNSFGPENAEVILNTIAPIGKHSDATGSFLPTRGDPWVLQMFLMQSNLDFDGFTLDSEKPFNSCKEDLAVQLHTSLGERGEREFCKGVRIFSEMCSVLNRDIYGERFEQVIQKIQQNASFRKEGLPIRNLAADAMLLLNSVSADARVAASLQTRNIQKLVNEVFSTPHLFACPDQEKDKAFCEALKIQNPTVLTQQRQAKSDELRAAFKDFYEGVFQNLGPAYGGTSISRDGLFDVVTAKIAQHVQASMGKVAISSTRNITDKARNDRLASGGQKKEQSDYRPINEGELGPLTRLAIKARALGRLERYQKNTRFPRRLIRWLRGRPLKGTKGEVRSLVHRMNNETKASITDAAFLRTTKKASDAQRNASLLRHAAERHDWASRPTETQALLLDPLPQDLCLFRDFGGEVKRLALEARLADFKKASVAFEKCLRERCTIQDSEGNAIAGNQELQDKIVESLPLIVVGRNLTSTAASEGHTEPGKNFGPPLFTWQTVLPGLMTTSPIMIALNRC